MILNLVIVPRHGFAAFSQPYVMCGCHCTGMGYASWLNVVHSCEWACKTHVDVNPVNTFMTDSSMNAKTKYLNHLQFSFIFTCAPSCAHMHVIQL